MKWPTKKLKFAPVAIYGVNVWLATDIKTHGKAAKVLHTETPTHVSGCYSSHINENTGEMVFLIGVFNGDDSVLAHECAHAAFGILLNAGVDPLEGNNEAYCYLLGYLFRELKAQL